MKKAFTLVLTALILSTFFLTSCSKDDEKNNEPAPASTGKAKYTVMVYGNAGGQMDKIIENVWRELKPMLTDSTNVRVVFLYKYGGEQNFSGQYAHPGDVVWFELTNETNLDSLQYSEGILQAPGFPLYNPLVFGRFINFTKQYCPAENYILVIYGHGGGFDITTDAPNNIITSKGVLYDELDNHRGMSMYELNDGLASSSTHFGCIFFHNCLLGNIENLTEVQQHTDYLISSEHNLYTNGAHFIKFIETLKDYSDLEEALEQYFIRLKPIADEINSHANQNIDLSCIRSANLSLLNFYLGEVSNCLVELYPTHKEIIDSAADHCYRVSGNNIVYLYDLNTYLASLRHFVDDSLLNKAIDSARTNLEKLFMHRYHYNNIDHSPNQYSISIVLGHHDFLHLAVKGTVIASAYYPSAFNRLTGWANWLNTNTYWPTITACETGISTVPWESFRDKLLNLQ